MPPAPRVLVVQTGSTNPAVIATHGDYDGWFVRFLEDAGARPSVVRAFSKDTLPMMEGWDGLLLTGSPLSVRDEAPWMGALAAWTLRASERMPVLAVCFGHQLIGEALGGRVEANPRGGEYGTISVGLTEAGRADPLFEGLPDTLRVQSTHRDILVRPPEGAVLLGGNENTAWQSFAWGRRLRAVQFHPEMSEAAMRDLLHVRGIEAPVSATDHGKKILQNWLDAWVFPA